MITGNEPAMPRAFEYSAQYDHDCINEPGLTLRQYFAGLAAQGILSGADVNNQNGIYVNGGFIHPATVAKDAVQIADAIISELNKSNQ